MPTVGTTHHLKLGTEFLMVRPGSYQKKPAPMFGARFTTGDPDYNNLSFWQHWVQDDFSGGAKEEVWIDSKMYLSGVGVNTIVEKRATIGRLLARGTGADWTVGGATDVVTYNFGIYPGGHLLFVASEMQGSTASKLYKYAAGTDGWTSVAPGNFQIAAVTQFNGVLFFGGKDLATAALLKYTNDGATLTTVANPGGVGASKYIGAMGELAGKLYVCFQNEIWRLTSAYAWDGATVFYTIDAWYADTNVRDNVVAAEEHLGYLYFLTGGGRLYRTDGNSTLEVWAFPSNEYGGALKSFDGKLFVTTSSFDASLSSVYLYQFSGSAVTEIKRWKGGSSSYTVTTGKQMAIHGRFLLYTAGGLLGEAAGFGVVAYDPVNDSHHLVAIQTDTTTYPDTLGGGISHTCTPFMFDSDIHVGVRTYGIFRAETNLIIDPAVTSLNLFNTSTAGVSLVSSDYYAGTPGLQKLWYKITVDCNLPHASTSFVLSYSMDGGTVWTSFTAVSGINAGPHVFYLQNKRGVRLRWRVNLKTTNAAKTPLLRSVIVAYLPQPEPNWMWSFTVPVTDTWELMDGTAETKTVNTLVAYLQGLFRAQDLVTFIDADGVTWGTNGPGVLIYDMTTIHYLLEGPAREGDIRITLLEAVETY